MTLELWSIRVTVHCSRSSRPSGTGPRRRRRRWDDFTRHLREGTDIDPTLVFKCMRVCHGPLHNCANVTSSPGETDTRRVVHIISAKGKRESRLPECMLINSATGSSLIWTSVFAHLTAQRDSSRSAISRRLTRLEWNTMEYKGIGSLVKKFWNAFATAPSCVFSRF